MDKISAKERALSFASRPASTPRQPARANRKSALQFFFSRLGKPVSKRAPPFLPHVGEPALGPRTEWSMGLLCLLRHSLSHAVIPRYAAFWGRHDISD